MDKNLSQKSINNAISAYLLVFISGLFLLNKQNQYINNSFVKKHTISANLIHLWFIINIVIFSFYWLLWWNFILWVELNNIISSSISIFLLFLIIIWIYKAKNWKSFQLINFIWKTSQTQNLENTQIHEKEKLDILISYIPFIWLLNSAKKDNNIINNALKLNIFITLIISLLYISGYINLLSLISLIYIIYITYIGINIFSTDKFSYLKISDYLTISKLRLLTISFFIYIKNYLSEDNFKEFNTIYKQKIEYRNILIKDEKLLLNKKNDLRINKNLIYIPILNLIFLFKRSNKYINHIINWSIISFIFILIVLLSYFWLVNIQVLVLLLFPIFYWIGIIKKDISYRMPLIFDIYIVLNNMMNIFTNTKKDISKKRNTDKNISLKPKK